MVQQQAEMSVATPRLSVVAPLERTTPASTADRAESTAHAWTSMLAALPHIGLGRLAYFCVGKRAIDLIAAVVLLVVLSPILAVIAIAIRKDSPGPAVFRQTRVGRGGRQFTVYKFRTMRIDPEGEELKLFRDKDGQLRHKVKDDPRVTKLGRFLRKSSLDELPQLLNVVRGEMSLVGPRPELPQIVRNYEAWQHARHLVRPGITGWWQVSGRSDLPMHENTGFDIHYVEHVSLWMDVKIVLKTIKSTVKGIGAF
jgi:exopolysaccharide biosynthesis polyprenyl glycosylphosphotransferase